MKPTCEQYLEDPDVHVEHLRTCGSCRAMAEELDANVEVAAGPMALDALPLAPWEGASHRPWGLVIVAAVAALAAAAILFLFAGISPLAGVTRAISSIFPPFDFALNLANHFGGALRNAPLTFQIGLALSFFLVNTLLFLLLRRAPKGIDV